MESIKKPGMADTSVPFEGLVWFAIDSARSDEALTTAESMLDKAEDRIDPETVRQMRAAIKTMRQVQEVQR